MTKHKPKLVVHNIDEQYTINFCYNDVNNEWKANMVDGEADFFWSL